MADNSLPIDIHYNKLLDWLINRRHCNQDWQKKVLEIREKINNAIQDMPAVDEITQLLTGTYINYFHCLRIVELLKDTESATKNIFGRYSSQRMKDWQEVVKLYEKDGIYLAEAAQMLARNVNYEIPLLKKQISKCQQQQQDCTRKEGEYTGQSAELKTKYSQRCQNMGIKGEKVKRELLDLVKDLPGTYEQIARDLKQIQPAYEYYHTFIQFTTGRDEISGECLDMINHVVNKGNTTVYEWKHGKAPFKVEEVVFNVNEDSEDIPAEDGADIDWGDDNNIDFGISLEGGGDTIDFGEEGIEISETLDIVEDTAADTANDVARGDEALTLLDNVSTRNVFIDELFELDSFFKQRLQEMAAATDTVTSSLLQNAPNQLQQDIQRVENLAESVTKVLSQLTSPRMQDLMLIRSSPRYVDRLADSLKRTLIDSDKMSALAGLMVVRRKEALDEQKATEPTLDLLRTRTKQLQNQVEKEISKKYKNRPVNIMGEINTV